MFLESFRPPPPHPFGGGWKISVTIKKGDQNFFIGVGLATEKI
jgi:hypothetical protein